MLFKKLLFANKKLKKEYPSWEHMGSRSKRNRYVQAARIASHWKLSWDSQAWK